MDSKSIYFKSLSISNLRCFKDRQKVNFYCKGDDGDNKVSRWNVILGENGIGKTSILRALALTIANPSIGKQWQGEIPWQSFHRSGSHLNPLLDYEVMYNNDEQLKFELEISGIGPGFSIYKKHLTSFASIKENLVLFGYGASRRIGNKGIASDNDFSAKSLFKDNVELINAEEWLVQADYLTTKNSKYGKLKEKVIDAIRIIMKHEVTDISIGVNSKNRPEVLFKTSYGEVPLHELSMGYKTFLAWMVDFAKGMIDKYAESANPLAEPAVCLLDEIDLHLHPKLQRNVVDFLLETFKQTQFIVSSHSPLIVQSNNDVNLILLNKVKDYVVVENNPESIANWRIDQILVSDLFGLKSSRSEQLESLWNERERLLGRKSINKSQEKRIAEIEQQVGNIPVWENKYERKAISAIDKIAEMLESKERAND